MPPLPFLKTFEYLSYHVKQCQYLICTFIIFIPKTFPQYSNNWHSPILEYSKYSKRIYIEKQIKHSHYAPFSYIGTGV